MSFKPCRHDLHTEGSAKQNLDDYDRLSQLVYTVANMAGMRILNVTTNHVFASPRTDFDGYSVLALITTSHISLHTWPAYNYYMFDLVSCLPFDRLAVMNTLGGFFGQMPGEAEAKLAFPELELIG